MLLRVPAIAAVVVAVVVECVFEEGCGSSGWAVVVRNRCQPGRVVVEGRREVDDAIAR